MRSDRCRTAAIPIALTLAALAAPSEAEATTVRALSLRQKAEIAPVVVHGIVQRTTVEWEVPEARVHTLLTLRVTESVKGGHEPGELIVVRQPGGTLDGFTMTAPGLATYAPGDEVILFLEPFGPYLVSIGIGIGTYRVEAQGDARWVTHAPQVSGVTFVEGRRPVIEPIRPMEPTPLHVFMKTLRSHARKISTQPRALPRKGAQLKSPPEIPALRSH